MAGGTLETCCICLAAYMAEDAPFVLSCGHGVHSHCMLRLCLTDGGRHRCPYCRAPAARTTDEAPTDLDSVDSDSEADSESDDELTPPPQPAPQWLSLTFWPQAQGQVKRRQEAIVKRVLQKARCKDAPRVLKSCAASYAAALQRRAAQRESHRRLKSSRAKGTVVEVLSALRKSHRATHACERKLGAQLYRCLQRCRNSAACREFLARHPPARVA